MLLRSSVVQSLTNCINNCISFHTQKDKTADSSPTISVQDKEKVMRFGFTKLENIRDHVGIVK